MERYVCVHGHFYQPPRENPWLDTLELQDSAYPYHDWNERITAECYAPNASSRILGLENEIVRIVNNYAKMSFNFGPTLLSWMEKSAPDVYQSILDADKASMEKFSGHGSAMAQAYNHIIMPLATSRDKYTQVLWGIKDFEHRYGRKPEGMWLAETAVDLETLEIMAELGIKFSVFAPYQASRVRPKETKGWQDVSGGKIDPTMPYECKLPSGKSISLFFYDGPISRAVAFERLLGNGEIFAKRLMDGFSPKGEWPKLVHIATDGETYGHHHRHGEMALSYALHYIEEQNLARLTNYGEYLEKFPPTHEVEIFENTSWSCAHGIERWKGDCGCNSGMHPKWGQSWRAPLRDALDWLRDEIYKHYEEKGKEFLNDPWAARDRYIQVLLSRTPETIDVFLRGSASRELSDIEKFNVLKLLEISRLTMVMYTSCGWFFDELSGIETVQIIQYAGRAIQLAEEVFGCELEKEFEDRLEKAKSNVSGFKDGKWIYEKFVKPAMVDLMKVGAHYAISSLFEEDEAKAQTYGFSVEREDYKSMQAGKTKMAVGRIRVTAEVTGESSVFGFGVIHLGDHNLTGGIRPYRGMSSFKAMSQEITKAFSKADFPDFIRSLDRHFGNSTYSLKSIFRDEQRKILGSILETTLTGAESAYQQVYQNHVPLMLFLSDLAVPMPKALQSAAEFFLNTNLRRAFESDELDFARISTLLSESRKAQISLDAAGLSYVFQNKLEGMMAKLGDDSCDQELLGRLESACVVVAELPFEVNLWKVQNTYYHMLQTVYPQLKQKAEEGVASAQSWLSSFISLGKKLHVQIPTELTEK